MADKKETFIELAKRWKQLQEMTNPQARGREFEPWLKDLFQASGLHAVGSFKRKNPQAELDGAIHHGFDTFYLEAKWKQKPINGDPVDKLARRIESSTIYTNGMLISVSGFNENAIQEAELIRPIKQFLVDTPHLEALLKQKIEGKTWLRLYMNITSREAKAYISIEEILREKQAVSLSQETSLKKLEKIAREYQHTVREYLKSRKYRDWYQHKLIPFSLEKVIWDETRFGVEPSGEISDLYEALHQLRHWVILGEAGIGKTTLIEKFLIDMKDSFPILVEPTNNSNDPIEVIQIALGDFGLSLKKDEIRDGLKLNYFSILVDGLDERNLNDREVIKDFCNTSYLRNTPILVTTRETVYMNLQESQRFPRNFGMLCVRPITPLKVRDYLDYRLGQQKGQKVSEAIAEKGIDDVFRTPLILDLWLKYSSERDFPLPRTKIEILEQFFSAFFDEWELPKEIEHHGSDAKSRILIRLAKFLFEKNSYQVKTTGFEQFFNRVWDEMVRQSPSLKHHKPPLDILIYHGLISRKGQNMGFAVPVYRDYFLIRGIEETTSTWYEKQHLAEICIDLNFLQKAMELYWDAAFDPDSNLSTKLAATIFLKKQGELEKAAEIIQGVLPTKNPVPHQIYALILKALGRYKEAEEQFKKGIKADPKDAPSYQAYGLMLKELGRFEEAEEQFKKGIKADPKNAPSYQAYGLLLKELGRFEEAEEQFKKGIKADPKNAPLFQAYALMLKEQGRFEEASEAMKKVLEIEPTISYKITFLDLSFYCLDRIEESESLVNQLLQDKKIRGNTKAHLNLARRLIEWRKDYLKGSSEAIENWTNIKQYTEQLINHNNFDTALIILKEFYNKQPSDFSNCQRLGRTLIQQGDLEGIRFLEKALELNPVPNLEIVSKILYSAIIAEHYDWVQKQLDLFLQKEPENSELLKLQGKLLAKKDMYESAKKFFQKAYVFAATSVKQATILREQARVLLDQDNPGIWEQTEILLEKAWILDPKNPGTFRMRQELYAKMDIPFEAKDIYQLIRERLETGDIIGVKLYRYRGNNIVQCYYYGVPGNLPWHEIARKFKTGDTVQAFFQKFNEKNELDLDWAKEFQQKYQKKNGKGKLFYQKQQELIKKLNPQVNQWVEVEIKELKSFGIIVQFQGLVGLIHISNIVESINYHWKSFPLGEGEFLKAKIIEIHEDGKIELSLEELLKEK